jgi:tRNA isopentenyl-2-thiomethyl-A-37 hydroxylase MiaE
MKRIEWKKAVFVSRRSRKKAGACGQIFLCFLLLAFAPGLVCGEEIDRLIAAVNGKVITEGDLDLARSLNVITLSGGSLRSDTRSQLIDRLIDQELLRQELQNFSGVREDEARVQARLQSLRDAYAEKGGIRAALQRLGLQESELIAYLRLQSTILSFVSYRFRPFASVSDEDIRKYYEGRLAAQLKKSGLELPPLPQIAGRIEEILREEKINAMLDQWIQEIKPNSRIDYFEDSKADE